MFLTDEEVHFLERKRALSGQTYQELADQIGMSPSFFSAILHQNKALPENKVQKFWEVISNLTIGEETTERPGTPRIIKIMNNEDQGVDDLLYDYLVSFPIGVEIRICPQQITQQLAQYYNSFTILQNQRYLQNIGGKYYEFYAKPF